MKFCFDRRMLETFSFTGISKNKGVPPKPPFKIYKSIVRVMFRTIYRADKTYTVTKHEQFLKTFFKHICYRGSKRRRTLESEDEEDCDRGTKRHRVSEFEDGIEPAAKITKSMTPTSMANIIDDDGSILNFETTL